MYIIHCKLFRWLPTCGCHATAFTPLLHKVCEVLGGTQQLKAAAETRVLFDLLHGLLLTPRPERQVVVMDHASPLLHLTRHVTSTLHEVMYIYSTYIYMCVYVCVYIYICVCVRMIFVCICYMYIYIDIFSYIYIYMCIRLYKYKKNMCVCVCALFLCKHNIT